MLYQREMADAPLDVVFEAYDLEDYVGETDARRPSPKRPDDLPLPKTRAEAEALALEELRAQEESEATSRVEEEETIERRKKQARGSYDYARHVVQGTLAHLDEIDDLIRRHAENWRLERMPTIDRNILRLALYEMLHEESVPKVVIVDEAIELAKKFGSENSSRFVNGLLDGVLKSELMARG